MIVETRPLHSKSRQVLFERHLSRKRVIVEKSLGPCNAIAPFHTIMVEARIWSAVRSERRQESSPHRRADEAGAIVIGLIAGGPGSALLG